MKNNRNLIISIVGVFIFVMLFGGISYAYFVYNKDVATVNLDTGEISIDFQNATTLSVTNSMLVNDEIGMNLSNYLDFTVNGTADTEAILYELEIERKSGSNIDNQYVSVNSLARPHSGDGVFV